MSSSNRSGRRVNVDANTIALWRLGMSVFGDLETGAEPGVNHDFITADPTTPPTSWSFVSSLSPSLLPTISSDGVFNSHNFNLTETSYMNSGTGAGVIGTGYTAEFGHYTEPSHPFAPLNENHRICSFRDGGQGVFIRVDPDSSAYNILGSVPVTYSTSDIDVFNWNDVKVRVKDLGNGVYIELYVNGEIAETSWSIGSGGAETRIGNDSTAEKFVADHYQYFRLSGVDPFLDVMGKNMQGDSAADGQPRVGTSPQFVDDPGVPFSSAVRFNGANGYILNTDASFEPATPFTAELWFKTFGELSTPGIQTIAAKEALNTSGWEIRLTADLQIQWIVANGSATTISGPNVNPNTWYHVALVHDGTNLIAYLNGDKIDSVAAGITINTANDFVLAAASDKTQLFLGELADFRMSNVARKPWEIYGIYNSTDDPQIGFIHDPDTIAVLNFDDDPGRLYTVSSTAAVDPKEIVLNSTQDINRAFTPISNQGPASTVVENAGRIRITDNFVAGETQQFLLDSNGRLRLVGDFDISVDFFYLNKNPGPPTVASWGGINRFALRIVSSTGGSSIISYREIGALLRMIYWMFGDFGDQVLLGTTESEQPNIITFRQTRVGNVWSAYYGLEGATATNLLERRTGPSDDCWIRFETLRLSSYTETGSYTNELGNIRVRGFNDLDDDGYLIRDPHGGVPSASSLVSSPIGTKARSFDGASSRINLVDNDDWDHTDLTIETWFNADTLHNGILVERKFRTAIPNFSLGLGADGYVKGEIADSAGQSVSAQSGAATYTAGLWHYVVLTFNSTTKKLALYLDGNGVASGVNASMSSDFASDLHVFLGRHENTTSEYFDGTMGAVRFSKTARSAKEIFDIFRGSNIKDG